MNKISVIVPVYNVEKYLEKCLVSLVNQTLKDIEIIIINDGSPDNSQLIIDRFKKKYPEMIKNYTKKNGGLSSARNEGLKYAKGEYISFVDSDDYLELDALELMYNKAKEYDYDVVACDLMYIYDQYTKIVSCRIKSDAKTKNEVKKAMIDYYPAACNKIYKTSLFKNLRFKNGIWYEDVELNYKMFSLINKIGVVNKPLYNYLQREGTITSTFNSKIFDYIGNWNGIIEYYKNNHVYDDYCNELEFCYIRYLYATMIKGMTNFSDYKMFKKGVSEAQYNVKSNFPNYRKNKYFYKSFKGVYLLLFNKRFAELQYKIKKRGDVK